MASFSDARLGSPAARLSVGEKIGYGLGDTAANFIFQTMLVFQTFFYTDVFGISPAEAGTLLLVARVWDAIFDPMMGVIADRTNTRWGKFRPWVLWTAIPFGLMGYLIFITPDLSHQGKLVYAYVTYIVFMTIYSANNLPYSALSGVMTADQAERTSLSSYRFVCAMLGGLAVKGLAPNLVDFFGRVYDSAGQAVIDPTTGQPIIDYARGYQWTMGIFSALCILLFVTTFLTTRERIQPDPSQTSSLAKDFGGLVSNGPWKAMFLVTLVVFVSLAMRGSILQYYFTYYLRRPDVFWLFLVAGQLANIVGILFSKPLALRFGKRNVLGAGLLGTALFYAAFFALPADDPTPAFVVEMIGSLIYGVTIPLLWAMMADVADYSEWTTGYRATGVIFAAIVFALKAGLGVGGAVTGWLLSFYGYDEALSEQTEQALRGIRLTSSIYPAIAFLAAVAVLCFYRIDRRKEHEILEALVERRKGFASS
jgi:sugar (glycoside-pentoside-hexuronide) transporter